MLRAILISAVSALLYTAIAAILDIVFLKNFKVKAEWVTRHVGRFVARFIWLVVFMYFSCKPFTIVTALTWMWGSEIFLCFMIIVAVSIGISVEGTEDKSKDESEDKSENFDFAVYTIMAAISVVVCILGCFAPTQEIVNVHNIAESKMVDSESVGSVLKQFKNTVSDKHNSSYFSVENSGMRRINDEDILVYHVSASAQSSEQYIPGYVIQKEGESLEVIQKRIYFDESFGFGKDALRTVRKKYQTEIIGKSMFDIDDEYNPYEVFLYRENLFFSNGDDYGVIVLNLNNGTSEKYSASSGEAPGWVDFESTYPR